MNYSRIIRQKNTVGVALKLSPGYLTREDAVQWVDNKKVQLTFYARVISSIYPLEGAVHKLMRTVEWDTNKDSERIIGAMKGLFDEKTNRRQIVRYIAIVMRTLFHHITSDNVEIARNGFSTLLGILNAYVSTR